MIGSKPYWMGLIAAFGLCFAACSDDDAELEVQVVTGLAPGHEFVTVQTEILDNVQVGRGRVIEMAEARASSRNDYARGQRVAQFLLAHGSHRVRVRLLRAGGAVLTTQTVQAEISGNYVLRVHITRDCVGVECPNASGPDNVMCLQGLCVDPRCSNVHPEFCPSIAFCESPSECLPVATCAQQQCDQGVCAAAPIADICDETSWCNPDIGCVPSMPDMSSSICGTICTLPAEPCRFGYWKCDSGVPVCTALQNRPFGQYCATDRTCDLMGECVAATPVVPAIIVTPTTGLVTSESGSTATFTMHLATAPTASVFVLLSSSDVGEATVAPAAIAFTAANFGSRQTVTVTGVNDAVRDGDQAFTIVTANATSADPAYGGLDVPDLSGTNLDDETPGIVVAPLSGLVTGEDGAAATFAVSLQAAPTADVTVPLASSDAGEGATTPTSVTFTPSNWSSPQVVTVTGVDDALFDGAQDYVVHVGPSTSTQPDYANLFGSDVAVTNEDDETGALVVSPLSGLVTTEAGGTSTFNVALNTQPSADVNVSVASTRAAEGSVAPSVLTFTSTNWETPQSVVVTGMDDSVIDGDQPYEAIVHVSSSSDPLFVAAPDKHVSIANVDDESPGITVSPTSGLVTSEAGGTAAFSIVLNAQPSLDVTIGLSSSTPSEGTPSVSSVTFTPSTWSMPRLITVTGVDDAAADGARAYNIVTAAAVSADTNYVGINASDVSITNLDNDTAGVTVSPMSGLVTTEAGGTATFSVTLNVAPTSDVTVTLSSSDTSEGTVLPASLTFNAGNWSTPQVVTVTGVNDFALDGAIAYTIVTSATSSASAAYNGLVVADVSVVNSDDDMPGVSVTPTSGLTTTEGGGMATFTLVLTSMPMADVSVGFTSSNLAEGTVSPASVTFTPSNWNTPRTITVTGVNDVLDDGDIVYTVITSNAMSSDADYAGVTVQDVVVSNTDDDMSGVTVTPTSGLTTTEIGGTAMFTMVLTLPPASDVTIGLTSSNVAEGTVSPASVTFTPLNWSTPQSVTVTGVNDALVDGFAAYSIITSAAASADPTYSGVAVSDVALTNQYVTTYVKASNPGNDDRFFNLGMSDDGNTVAVAAYNEDSNATGINGNQLDNSSTDSGAVYVFVRTGTVWSQQAYIKPAIIDPSDRFGAAITLSGDGNTLAVISNSEASSATGINGNAADNSAMYSGAAYVFVRTGTTWSQQAYVKTSNTNADDQMSSIALSTDGNTLAVGAQGERSNATGVGGNQLDNSLISAGAAYVFTRAGTVWTQQAYIKASNPALGDYFGTPVALSPDGNTLAVGAIGEDSNATGINGNQADNSATFAGAVYVFVRVGMAWSQQAYVKASNTDANDYFGSALAFSSDGNTMAVAGPYERSNATGVGGDQTNNTLGFAGAVYVFTRSGVVWTQQAYVKASNTNSSDNFGRSIALSLDGNSLAVGASSEASSATGIGGNQLDNSASGAGAAYVFSRSGGVWSQSAYVKAPNTGTGDQFGSSVAFSGDGGSTFVVGAYSEASNASGINGNQADNSVSYAGAVYIYE